jgi:hypothetical protein
MSGNDHLAEPVVDGSTVLKQVLQVMNMTENVLQQRRLMVEPQFCFCNSAAGFDPLGS